MENLTFETTTSEVFEVNAETRTIKGLVVPFGVVGDNGRKFTFSKDTDFTWPGDVSRVKLLMGHDFSAPVGYATALEKGENGITGTFKVARGPEGDRALSMAEDRVYDGLSMGLGKDAKFVLKDGVFHGTSAPIGEVSLTPLPAFDDARVTSVAASAVTERKEPTVGDKTETPEAPDFGVVLSKINELDQKFTALTNLPAREVVKAGESFQVTEALPYRFDGGTAEHGFLNDIIASKFGSGDAGTRLNKFLTEVFANEVTTGNVSALNPTQNRPELFVPALHYGRPLWNLVTQGTLDNVTAFTVPKFGSITGNATSAHTQGTEPTNAGYTATSQTITPGAISGKAILNREVVDQGGNPATDQIIWGEMVASYYNGVETALATLLNASTTTELNLQGASATADAALVKAIKAKVSGLQFVAGGDRFTGFAAADDLYGALVAAADTTGRPLLPTLGPTNADGSLAPSYESVQVGPKRIVPSWSLAGLGNAKRSFLFVPTSVYAWVSAPKRIDIEYQVKSVEIGIWGYQATAITRDSDVLPIDFTTADS
jgi:HK97 family phage prohead protease